MNLIESHIVGMPTKNLLFIHQSADMYGSDKVLLSLVTGLDRERFNPIVMLPEEGDLLGALQDAGVETHVVPLVRLSRAAMTLPGILRIIRSIRLSLESIDSRLAGRKISIVHSNTLAVLSGAFWARIKHIPHVWHVHEMIVHPHMMRYLFPLLLRIFSDRIACNSDATRNWMVSVQPVLERRSVTIWNGLERIGYPDKSDIDAFRKEIGLAPEDLLVVLMGRINRLKGHKLLIDAAEIVRKKGVNNIRYLMVGSPPPGQHHYLDELEKRIGDSMLSDRIAVMKFQDNIWRIWDAADIAVVPSTEPEAFGMVALEAMCAGKPVIASAHGGLPDVVVHNETGILVSPCDEKALADAIADLARNGEKRKSMGEAGLSRSLKCFSQRSHISRFEKLYGEVIE